MAATEWAIICSNYINAYSIVRSLQALKWKGRIVSTKQVSDGIVLTDLCGKDVQIWSLNLGEPKDMIDIIADRIPPEENKTIFFCDEAFHEAFRDYAPEKLQNANYFIGSFAKLDVILDKYALYGYLTENELAEVPETISSDKNPWQVFNDGFFLRPKRSLIGMKKLPRVTLIRHPDHLTAVESEFLEMGMTRDDWCYQEKLSLDPHHNVSVCGWHDEKDRIYYATHHVLRHPPDSGNGDITEIIDPPAGLFAATESVLTSLQYQGPFELEFILDLKDSIYKVIELNPRFWMQHALINTVSGHALVRKYIGAQNIERKINSSYKSKWVNTVYSLWRIFKLNFKVIPYLANSKNVFVPDLLTAIKWIPVYIMKKLR